MGESLQTQVIVRQCRDGAEWDDFAQHVPWATPQHSFAWGQALGDCFGYLQPAYQLFLHQGRPVAGLPLIRFSVGRIFRAAYSLSFDSYGGPLIHPEYVDDSALLSAITRAVDDEAAEHRAFEVRFTIPPTAPESVVRSIASGLDAVVFRRECPLLDLDRPMERIVHGFRPAVRRGIRRSVRDGVVVEDDADIAQVRLAFPIYVDTMQRLNGTAKPWRFVENLLRARLAVPFVARTADRITGLVILLVSPRMAIYWISAADPAYSSSRPSLALLERAIHWCHDRGIRVFSFGESPGERAGLVRFKESWGPEHSESTTVIRVYRPMIHRAWLLLEPIARGTYGVWDRLRNPVT